MATSYKEPKIAPEIAIRIAIVIVELIEAGGERNLTNVKSKILMTLA